MGFCLFNNVAIGAKYALKKYGLDKILLIDWDLHHGNATQHTFYDDREVLYFSTHQYPYYPGTGGFDEVGANEGKGFNVNVPLSPGPGDDDYAGIYIDILKPITLEYKPQLILVSAGFDIYFDDPLGGMGVTPAGFARLTKIIMELAKQACEGKTLFILEGGYHLDGLRDSVEAVFLELLEDSDRFAGRPFLEEKIESSAIDPVINRVRAAHKDYWPCLS
jgi:acetoin utilization deacetylase AcuC-like enzyme